MAEMGADGAGMGLSMLSGGLGAIGSLLGGIGALTAGTAQQKAYNAAARQARQEAGVNSSIALDQGTRAAARGAVAAAANGGGFEGSAISVLSDLSMQSMQGARAAVYRGETEARRDEYMGKVARAQGNLGLVKGLLGMGGSLLSGAQSSAYERSANLSRMELSGYGRPGYGLPDAGYGYGGGY